MDHKLGGLAQLASRDKKYGKLMVNTGGGASHHINFSIGSSQVKNHAGGSQSKKNMPAILSPSINLRANLKHSLADSTEKKLAPILDSRSNDSMGIGLARNTIRPEDKD